MTRTQTSNIATVGLTLLIAVQAATATAPPWPIVEWARSAGGRGTYDWGHDIAVDPSGNIYVTGRFEGAATFGPYLLTSAGGYSDIFVVKYSADGDVLWARAFGGEGNDVGNGIAVDSDGNSYVTGYFSGAVSFGVHELQGGNDDDIVVSKLNVDGNVLWAQSAGGSDNDYGFAVAIDDFGNSVVTGLHRGTASFGPFTLVAVGDSDVFVAKYDNDGTVLWAQSAGGPSPGNSDVGKAIALDNDGNCYVSGYFSGVASFGPYSLASAGVDDVFAAKYDSGGSVLWARSGGGGGSDIAYGIGVDAVGNSYITGWCDPLATFGPFTLTGSSSAFAVKYDAQGNELWAWSPEGSSPILIQAIAVESSGNSYVTGKYYGTAIFGAFSLVSSGADDICISKIDSEGTVVWAQSVGGGGNDEEGLGVAVDAIGDCYVTGAYNGTASFGSQSLSSEASSKDIFVVKYSEPRPPVWSGDRFNRYLVFTDNNPGIQAAYRVNSSAMAGAKWIQAPETEGSAAGVSRLGCPPVYRDWGGVEIRVADGDIIPGDGAPRVYTVESTADGLSFTPVVNMETTSRWGDTNGTGTITNADIIAVLNGFQGIFTLPYTNPPRKETVDMRSATDPPSGVPNVPDFAISNADIIMVLNAFQGSPYPFTFAAGCP